jgi:NLI interacting factor-like phosphatase
VPPIYVDLDLTLCYPIWKDEEQTDVERFVFRPGALQFLEALTKFGDLYLLTASYLVWAERALSERKDLKALFVRLITMDDMEAVGGQVKAIFELPGLSDHEKLDMMGMIRRIADPGVIFDDQPYGSDAWFLKSLSTGSYDMGPDLWIRVDRFTREDPDSSGLRRALHRFRNRNARWKGGNSMELSGGPGYNPITAPS